MGELIAFDGKDGVGKTELAKRFANNNNLKYEPQRIIELLKTNEANFKKFVKFITYSENNKLSALFYVFKCMLDRETKENIVVERTMASVHYFEEENFDEEEWNYYMQLGVIPNLTFLLYASPEVRRKRIENRDPKDPDLNSCEIFEDDYYKMIDFMDKYKFPYVFINTDFLSIEEEEKLCTYIYNNYKDLSNIEKEDYLKDLNERNGINDYLHKEKCLSLRLTK